MRNILNHVAEAASEVFDKPINAEDLKGKNRVTEIVMARQTFCKILRMFTPLSWSSIAGMIGKDHATAIHSVKVYDNAVGQERKTFDLIFSKCKDAVIQEIDLNDQEAKLRNAILVEDAEAAAKLKEDMYVIANRERDNDRKKWDAKAEEIKVILRPENKCPGFIRHKIEKILAGEFQPSRKYTIEDIVKCVENWGMCRVEKEYIEKFLNKS